VPQTAAWQPPRSRTLPSDPSANSRYCKRAPKVSRPYIPDMIRITITPAAYATHRAKGRVAFGPPSLLRGLWVRVALCRTIGSD
jgi:hypothetical protein